MDNVSLVLQITPSNSSVVKGLPEWGTVGGNQPE